MPAIGRRRHGAVVGQEWGIPPYELAFGGRPFSSDPIIVIGYLLFLSKRKFV
jgi:hypothetical protein